MSALALVAGRPWWPALVALVGTGPGGLKKSRELGMQTFDQALFDLYEADRITYEDALRNADSVNDLRLNIKLNSKHAKDRDFSSGTETLGLI